MSNINLIIEERAASIGSFWVGRLLPFRQKRMVGPFIYIDHMGPVKLSERDNFDVLPHPHIGLSTLTYLFEGSIMHRDSIGTLREVKPGEVNWMTAGKGIVHSERTPEYLRHSEKHMHGLQIWVALPKQHEQTEPNFTHVEADALPTWVDGNVTIKLVAGEVLDKKSPVPVYSKLYMLELKNTETAHVNLGQHLYGESGLYILQGSVEVEGNTFEKGQLLVKTSATLCAFTMSPDTIVYIFGGEPFAEERFIDWNFVASDKALIEAAKQRWKAQQFPKIPNDDVEFVPYPEGKR